MVNMKTLFRNLKAKAVKFRTDQSLIKEVGDVEITIKSPLEGGLGACIAWLRCFTSEPTHRSFSKPGSVLLEILFPVLGIVI